MMDIQLQLIIGIVIASFYIFLNVQLSKEILTWEPSLVKRVSLVLAIWVIPVIGAVVAYKYLDLDWFTKQSKKSPGTQNVVGGALLEVDAIFNPGQRHVIETRKKEHVELNEDGQLHNNGRVNLISLEKNQTNEPSEKT